MSELFIVGAQRSGTTYLYNVLDAHPQILMAKPVRPEPKYFLNDELYARGKDYYESLYYPGRKEYHRYIGEKSTSYIESKKAVSRIKEYYPAARILIILRNPIERAYSNYKFSVNNGLEKLSFKEALNAEKARLASADYASSVNPFAYAKRGHYIRYIELYAERFEASQMNILISEEFIENSSAITELYQWLGVNCDYMPPLSGEKVNPSTGNEKYAEEFNMMRDRLHEEFSESNTLLERYLGREIHAWKLI